MTSKPSAFGFMLGICLVWITSATLDSFYPDMELFLHVFVTVIVASKLWSLISFIHNKISTIKIVFFDHKNFVDDLIKSGFSSDEIAAKLNDKLNAKPDTTEQIKIREFFVDADTPVCGKFQDQPIYECIRFENGEVYFYDGMIDITQPVDFSKINSKSVVLKSGLVYSPKI